MRDSIRILSWEKATSQEKQQALLRPVSRTQDELTLKVREILSEVRSGGDAVVKKYTERFDRVQLDSLLVSRQEIEEARKKVSPQILSDLKEAIRRITLFHQAQLPQSIRVETGRGMICERRFLPIERVGLYIPGGTAPLPSTVMMLGVPSQVAGCSVRVLATPPRSTENGTIDPVILVTADLLGIQKIFKVGGAQAIAALAYGTETIPKVDKIFGPGNSWVTEAKQQVAQDPSGASVDLPAGPSEVMVIADDQARADFVASDLLSQAEHGEDSQVVLVAQSREFILKTLTEVERQLARLPRREIAQAALSKSLCVECKDLSHALEVCNQYAPEHLVLQLSEARAFSSQVKNAGSVFIGPYTPESLGDYASGTNHVLPTYGYARAIGGVTTESFLKSVTYQEASLSALQELGPVVMRLAQAETLDAHAAAVRIRLEKNI